MSRQSGTFAVVMAPTRELCIQIYDVLALILRRYHWVVRLCLCISSYYIYLEKVIVTVIVTLYVMALGMT